MKVFGHEIELKAQACARVDIPATPIAPFVNVYVRVTNVCNAHCPFCSNAAHTGEDVEFDLPKLVGIVRELRRSGVRVNHLNVTGGEPSLVYDRTLELVRTFSADEFRDIRLQLNTNGLGEASHRLMRERRWDYVAISRHHYDAAKLASLYGLGELPNVDDFTGVDLEKVTVLCNLIRGFTDSQEEVRRMMDYTLALGVRQLGFVALMRLNDYCRERFVDIEDVGLERVPGVHFTASRHRGTKCKCTNYLYSSRGRILEVYQRNYADPSYCESSLTYDGRHLRQGFLKEEVIV